MLIAIGAIVFFNLTLTLIYERRIGSPFIAFPLGLIFVFAIPYYIFIGESYSIHTGFVIGTWGVLFTFFYLTSRVFFSRLAMINWQPNLAALKSRSLTLPPRITIVTSILIATSLLASFYNFNFSLREMASQDWGYMRMNKESSTAGLLTQYLFCAASAALLIAWITRSKYLFFLCTISLIYFIVIIKTRSYVVSILGPILIAYILSSEIKLKNLTKAIAISSLLIFAYIITRAFRLSGNLSDVLADPSLIVATLSESDLGELALLKAFFHIVEFEITNENFNSNNGFIRLIMLFIPASMSGGMKPLDMGYAVWDSYIGILGLGGSFHATAIADSYFNDKNFGYITYPVFYAIAFTIYEKTFLSATKCWLPIFGVVVVSCLAIARGSIYNGFSLLLIGGGIIFIAIKISDRFYINKNQTHRSTAS